MRARLERPAYITRQDGSRALSPEYIADLLALEQKLESVLRTGEIDTPPRLIARLLRLSPVPVRKALREKDRRRFEEMLADVRKAIEESTR